MTGSSGAIDLTNREILPKLVALAWPSVLQAVLSNCYAFNDFVFAGHIRDPKQASAATAALSATVGLQIIAFSLHNCIPSGSNTFASQYRGAGDSVQLSASFRAGFFSCMILSTIVSVVGVIYVEQIASMCNSSTEVTAAVVEFFGTILMYSPAFGLMLLVDGFFKACGDTLTPLRLEIFSLVLNTALNYLFVIHYNLGIKGAAYATVASRFIPAMVGIVGIKRGWLGIDVQLLPCCFAGTASSANPSPRGSSSVPGGTVVRYALLSSQDDHAVELTLTAGPLATGTPAAGPFCSAAEDSRDAVTKEGKLYAALSSSDMLDNEAPDTTDADTLAGAVALAVAGAGTAHGVGGDENVDDDSAPSGETGATALLGERLSLAQWLCDVLIRSWAMAKIGVCESIGQCIYGLVFTVLIRLAGQLGPAQQAGLGAGLRGIEWIAFCVSEGFLVSAATATGQCIGAGQYKRAMHAALWAAALSAVCAGVLGLPFIFFAVPISRVLSGDEEIVRYCAMYVRVSGYIMVFVGWEMASYGAMLGAGQARKLVLMNGSMNLARIPTAVLCIYGKDRFWRALAWAIGLSSFVAPIERVGDLLGLGGLKSTNSANSTESRDLTESSEAAQVKAAQDKAALFKAAQVKAAQDKAAQVKAAHDKAAQVKAARTTIGLEDISAHTNSHNIILSSAGSENIRRANVGDEEYFLTGSEIKEASSLLSTSPTSPMATIRPFVQSFAQLIQETGAVGLGQGLNTTAAVPTGTGSGPLTRPSTGPLLSAQAGQARDSGLGAPTGGFGCICIVIAGTAVMKASLFCVFFAYRCATGKYFSDSRVIIQTDSVVDQDDRSGSSIGSRGSPQ